MERTQFNNEITELTEEINSFLERADIGLEKKCRLTAETYRLMEHIVRARNYCNPHDED